VDFIYIAALGRLNSMPVNAMEYRSMPKGSTLAQITAETRRFEQDIRKDYAALVRMLISAGVLTSVEAGQLPDPQVSIEVYQ
jgi:hypothetical protein